eukprot:1927686-Alexandrium_andersonii.AAC.1
MQAEIVAEGEERSQVRAATEAELLKQQEEAPEDPRPAVEEGQAVEAAQHAFRLAQATCITAPTS